MRRILLIFLLMCFWSENLAMECIPRCKCSGLTVNCANLQLIALPVIPAIAKSIDLRFNQIRELNSISVNGSIQLHTIFLNENKITTITKGTFDGFNSLQYMYLQKNKISHIDKNGFIGLRRLHTLFLQYNELEVLNMEIIFNLPMLERLYLNNNKITRIINWSLRHNPLLTLIQLNSNKVVCDCSIISILQSLKEKKTKVTALIQCDQPAEMYSKDISLLREADFQCKKPHIFEEPHNIIATKGETVKFSCQAQGDPKPDIIWMLNSNEISLDNSNYQLLPDGSLMLHNVNDALMGEYECMATSSMGTAKSSIANLYLNYELHTADRLNVKPTIKWITSNITVSRDDQVILTCLTEGTPRPSIIWYFNDDQIKSFDGVQVLGNGSMLIEYPIGEDSGTYKCEAINEYGSATAEVHVTVQDVPTVFIEADNSTLKIGSKLELKCKVNYPNLKVLWEKNDLTLINSDEVKFSFGNQNLLIQSVKLSDTGRYKCIAENAFGEGEYVVDIKVEQNNQKPRFFIEPFDIETHTGVTVELPCEGEDDDLNAQIKWSKDGKTIKESAKYRISNSGNLFIKKIAEEDGGRYECSLINDYGRATSSGLVKVKKNDALLPGDQFVKISFSEASKEIEQSINQTISSLFNKSATHRHNELFKMFRYPDAPIRELARAAEIYERTLVNIRKHVDSGATPASNISNFDYKDILSPEHLTLVAELSGCQSHRIIPNCTNMCFHLKYRSIDGTCNNLQRPHWGASLTGFRRILPPIYENGFSTPIGWNKDKLYFGHPKPSARLVSTSVISTETITPDERITHMVMQWGQFLDHDLDHAIPSVSSESWDGIDCKKTCEYASPCYPIEVPKDDPRIKDRRCIDLVRSSAICGSGMTSVFFDEQIQHREQINQLTSYIDASQVYGYSLQFSRDLRDLTSENGLLRVGVHFPNQKSMLPFAAPTDGIDCRRDISEANVNCFVAGDIRVNEQIGLAAMHTLWLREHNRIATELKEHNQHWDGDTLYHEARKIVGAQMQHITYTQWLPIVLGPVGMKLLGEYKGYDPTVNPSISNEFATAALRFGHTLINPILHRLNETFEPIAQGHLPLHKAFFSPWRLVYEGGVDPLLRGMFSVPAKLKLPTENLNTELTEKLFLTAHAVALDLAAINIQRSRDHGIPGYNEYRKFCNLKEAIDFEDLATEISDASVRAKLKELYGHPGNIDIFVGGILEDQIDGARIGPTFRCILVEQFKRLRDGDRHWYENPATFRPEQLSQIKLASLGRVLCDNGDNITQITDNVFFLPKEQGGFKQCSTTPKINLATWLNCDKCYSTFESKNYTNNGFPIRRQRRSINPQDNIETFENISNLNKTNFYDIISYEETQKQVQNLELMIGDFEKKLSEMRSQLSNIEKQCSVAKEFCVDDAGIRREDEETWSKDECTLCNCKSMHINCAKEACQNLQCGKNEIVAKVSDKCCPVCQLLKT